MLLVRASQVALLVSALAVSVSFAGTTNSSSNRSHHRIAYSRKSHGRRATHLHGQRAIDSERASQIQEALISRHYLTGSPSGQWDAETQTAMKKYQADHGWQTKLMPDSRALISLGLGPSPTAPADAPKPEASVASAPNQRSGSDADDPSANTLASVHLIPSS